MSVVIQADNLSKQYRLGTINAKRLREDVNRWLAKLRGKEDPLSKVGPGRMSGRNIKPENGIGQPPDTIWALRDVSFEVKRGEVLGVIGRNGAGKSTLLKILSRVTAPTVGEVRVKGRIASLLEVGTGFNPELTGRDNIFLNGAILGMTKAEIKRKFEAIVAFSEVEKFIDTPVKRYSSGMYVRLAFAVAAHLEPEILIVDEVLAVGDASFQKKCLGKMQDVAEEGRTVLFVSHNMIALQSLCHRAVLLKDGRLVLDDSVAVTISRYLNDFRDGSAAREWSSPQEAPGNDTVRIRRVRVAPEEEASDRIISMQTAVRIETEYWVLAPAKTLHITYHLLNEQGIVVLTSFSKEMAHENATYRAQCILPGNLLNSGNYCLSMLVVEGGSRVIYRFDSIVSFEVVDAGKRDGAWMGREPGVVQPVLPWTTHKLTSALA